MNCSFCGHSHFEVKRLIVGPNVFICDECIKLCVEAIELPIRTDDKNRINIDMEEEDNNRRETD